MIFWKILLSPSSEINNGWLYLVCALGGNSFIVNSSFTIEGATLELSPASSSSFCIFLMSYYLYYSVSLFTSSSRLSLMKVRCYFFMVSFIDDRNLNFDFIFLSYFLLPSASRSSGFIALEAFLINHVLSIMGRKQFFRLLSHYLDSLLFI